MRKEWAEITFWKMMSAAFAFFLLASIRVPPILPPNLCSTWLSQRALVEMKKPARTPSALWEFLSRRRAAKRFTHYIDSPTAASHLFHLSRFVCHYWRIKINDPVFHPLRHGGLRYFFSFLSNSDSLRWRLFNDQNTAKMKGLLWLNVITDLFQAILELGKFIPRSFSHL